MREVRYCEVAHFHFFNPTPFCLGLIGLIITLGLNEDFDMSINCSNLASEMKIMDDIVNALRLIGVTASRVGTARHGGMTVVRDINSEFFNF
jgi:hypothetical protein